MAGPAPALAFWLDPVNYSPWFLIRGLPYAAPTERLSRERGDDDYPSMVELGDHADPFSDPAGAMPVEPGVVYVNMLVQFATVKGTCRIDKNGETWHGIFPRLVFPFPQDGQTPAQAIFAQHDRIINPENMGRWGILPGELRNCIYEAIAIGPDAVARIDAKPECLRGACVHSKISGAVFGMASASQQVRMEVMGYYVGANKTFVFDPVAVRNKCSVQWVEALGHLAEDIHDIVLEVDVWVKLQVAAPNIPGNALPASGPPASAQQNGVQAITQGPQLPQTPQNGQNAQWVLDTRMQAQWEKRRCSFKVKLVDIGGQYVQIHFTIGPVAFSRLHSSREGLRVLWHLETFVETFNDDTEFCPECCGAKRCGSHTHTAILKRVLNSKNLENVIAFFGSSED